MFNFEVEPARQRLQDAIQFRRKGGGYWCPDLLIDRNAIELAGIDYKPSRDADAVLQQFGDIAWVEFIEE